jgi:hypothetical protein
MKWRFVAVALLGLLACRDPNSYQPSDPTKSDPPAPPVLDYPVNGWVSYDFAYPQNVNFGWQVVPGAQFYEVQITWDSLFSSPDPGQRVYQTSLSMSMSGYGLFFWRVRAASSRWNDYTDWSAPFHFSLPNPGRSP